LPRASRGNGCGDQLWAGCEGDLGLADATVDADDDEELDVGGCELARRQGGAGAAEETRRYRGRCGAGRGRAVRGRAVRGRRRVLRGEGRWGRRTRWGLLSGLTGGRTGGRGRRAVRWRRQR